MYRRSPCEQNISLHTYENIRRWGILKSGPGADRWVSLWHVHTNECARNRSACLLSREIIQPSALVSMHKEHAVQLCIFLLYRAGGWCVNKASNGFSKLPLWTTAVSKSVLIFSAHRQICKVRAVVFLWHWGCLFNVPLWVFVLQFPLSCGSSCLTSVSLSGPSESFRAKLTFFVFTAPLISSCFVPPPAAPDIAWCAEGMQLPVEFPHCAPPFLVPNFTLTNWPGVPLPLTSLCFPWRLGPVHELTGPVHPVQNTSQWRHGMNGHLNGDI